MEDVAHRAVVQDHDLAKIRLDLAQVFDVRTVAERAMLSIISPAEVLSLSFKPVDDRICVLLDRGGEDY